MTPELSFVLPNYNGAELLRRNLPAVLEAARHTGGETEVIVVDDASTDASLDVLEREFPDVRTLPRERNSGFSPTVNAGVEAASGGLVVLLNTDVRPEAAFLDRLLPFFDETETFAVSPLMRDENGRPQRTSLNLIEFRRGEIRKRRWDLAELIARAESGARIPHLYPCLGAAVLRREQFLRLGGLDCIFSPFYYEDFDLGIRAWQAGWRVYLEPRSEVVHEHRGSIASSFRRRHVKRVSRRNRFLLLWIHLSAARLWGSHVPCSLFRLATRLITLNGTYPVALWKALGRMGEVRRRRRAGRGKPSLDDLVRRIAAPDQRQMPAG